MSPEFLESARLIHGRLVEALDLRRRDVGAMSDHELRRTTAALLDTVLAQSQVAPEDLHALRQHVLDETLGLGVLEPLLREPQVSEIMVNGPERVFVERSGRTEQLTLRFSSEQALRAVIERMVAPIGRRVDDASPMVDARLPDGSRVNVVLAPLSLDGSAVTIRRFGVGLRSAEDLVRLGTLDARMLAFLRVAVRHRRNVVVSGGTGSGKTTLLNILSSLIPAHERIVTIEDAAELQLVQPNLVRLEARPRNLEGRGEIVIRDLVRNALRMRPDRIVVGECRGGEALDMLQAMNTGHDGSLTTVHANSPRDLLSRLEVMVMMAGFDLPLQAIREQIASAVHLIVQQARFACGARRITSITEVSGIDGGRIQMQELFRFVRDGVDALGRTRGHFAPSGHVPQFFERVAGIDAEIDLATFQDADGVPS